jgi:HK97 family phage major capsid protein
VCHSSVEAALQQMVSPVGSPALVYPAESPYGYLFGRPVLVTEAAQNIGTPGDIALVDPLGILTVTREGIVREDISMHVWWDLDLSAFRFVVRIGAVPWWSSTVTQRNGGVTVSSAVVLEAR